MEGLQQDIYNNEPTSVKSAVTELLSLEADKTHVNRHIKQLDSRRSYLQTYLMSELGKQEATEQGVVCDGVVVCVQDEEIGVVNDWDEFVDYMATTRDFSLIKRAAISSRIIDEIKGAYDWDFVHVHHEVAFEHPEFLDGLRDRTIYIGFSECYVCLSSVDLDKNKTLLYTSSFSFPVDYDPMQILSTLIDDGIIPAPPSCVEIIKRKKIKLKSLK